MTRPLITHFVSADVPGERVATPGARLHGVSLTPDEIGDLQEQLSLLLANFIASHRTAGIGQIGAADQFGQYVAELVTGRSIMLRLAPDMDDAQRRSVALFLDRVLDVMHGIEPSRQETAIAKLAEVILPDPLVDARGPLALDNLELRDRFVVETRPLTSLEVAEQAGFKGSNPYATATRWKKSGDVFSVHHRGTEYYPAFQFRDGRPHPSMRKVLLALPANLSPWQRAFWFVSTNGWLNGQAPADLLDDPEAVVAAALREAHEVAG